MKLKYADIDGFGVLINNNVEIKPNTWYESFKMLFLSDTIYNESNNPNNPSVARYNSAVIFAEKGLNLNIPILPNWKEWEVEQIAKEWASSYNYANGKQDVGIESFIAGYNCNNRLYTEDDLKRAILIAERGIIDSSKIGVSIYTHDDIVKALQKVPKYIEIESEYINGWSKLLVEKQNDPKELHIQPKLVINSDGDKECVIKKIYY